MSINMSRVAFYLSHICPAGHFEIGLCKRDSEMNEALCDSVLDRIVSPLVELCDQALLFGIIPKRIEDLPRRPLKRPAFPYVRKTNDFLELDIAKMPIDAKHRKLWRYTMMAEVNLLLLFREENFPLNEIASKSWDPVIVTNLKMAVAPSAMKHCRKMTSHGKYVCCLFSGDAGSFSMSIFATKQVLEKAYISCVKDCKFSGSGLKRELRPNAQAGHRAAEDSTQTRGG